MLQSMSKEQPIDPGRIFLELNDFIIATSELSNSFHGGEEHVLVPLVVNMAFTLELILKCLLTLQVGRFPRGNKGHDLHDLFNLLPEADQKAILDIHRDLSPALSQSPTNADAYFFKALEMARKDFVDIRYAFERPGPRETRSLGSLVLAGYHYIFTLRPDWEEHKIDMGLST